jgi:uncharacterized protein YdaU (DUF1376 family)
MSRAWIAFYMGDYQKDTNRLTTLEHGAYFLLLQECWTHGKIPLAPEDRAALTKMPIRDWLKIAPKINPYFEPDGTQRRATKEIEKAETIRTKRALAGMKGGTISGIKRAIDRGRSSKYEANGKQMLQQIGIQKGSPAEAIHNNSIDSSKTGNEEKGKESGKVSASPELINSLKQRGFLR